MRIILGLVLCTLATPAMALLQPTPGKQDPRMTTAVYDPTQTYAVHVPQGQTYAVILGVGELATDAFGGDKFLLRAENSGNTVVLWSGPAVVPPRSIFVRSRLPDGSYRNYVLMVDTKPPEEAAVSLTFTYPADDTAKKVAAWKASQVQKEQKAAEAVLKSAQGEADTNMHYVLQAQTAADWALLPTRQVSDNGTVTHFWFPGNMRIPIIYVESPDGKESHADYQFNSATGIATVAQLARKFRIRDGDAMMCVENTAFDPVGVKLESGTVNPRVERITK